MLISKKWLLEFVNIPESITSEKLAFDLTMKTVEVEKIKKMSDNLENIVVGLVKSVEKHPNADSLQLCQVSAGYGEKELYQVVCGGINIREGMLVAFGKLGAKVRWHGEGDLIILAKVKIRGVESFGMICGADEIGLDEIFPKKQAKEILDLGDLKVSAGTPLAEALGLDDVVYDIDNKSMTHRSDLWGHYGIAREVSAFYKQKLKKYEPPKIKKGKDLRIDITIEDKELCPRYMAVALNNIKVAPSPFWMQKRLLSVGLRPINNIVDITNYVMMELGQPMHAFDASRVENPKSEIRNPKIIVRRAKEGERFKTLDGVERKLDENTLVIANKEKPIALAGVMGGENSGIKDNTASIIFEVANFQAGKRHARRKHKNPFQWTGNRMRKHKKTGRNLCSFKGRIAFGGTG